MKKIAIITPFLARGGLEKVAISEATELDKYYDVTLIVLDSFIQDYPYSGEIIDLGVSLECRNVLKRIFNIGLTILKLRKLKKDQGFDIVISHGELANIPNALSGGRAILTVHENRLSAVKDFQGKLVNKIIQRIYTLPNIFKIVTVSKGIKESFIRKFNLDDIQIDTIYNPFDINSIKGLSRKPLEQYNTLFSNPIIISVGRLTTAKGQWHMLRAFKEIKKKLPEVKLVVLGDGSLKEDLITLSSNELNMKTYDVWSDCSYDETYDVYFLGFKNNPFKFIAHAKILWMTSLWEGFGNTIVESMACGVPVVSTDCKSGPREIIDPNKVKPLSVQNAQNGEYGILLPVIKGGIADKNFDSEVYKIKWTNIIIELLKDKEKWHQYSQKGLRRVENFRLEKIILEWVKLINCR